MLEVERADIVGQALARFKSRRWTRLFFCQIRIRPVVAFVVLAGVYG